MKGYGHALCLDAAIIWKVNLHVFHCIISVFKYANSQVM